MKSYIYQDEKSHKFWAVEQQGKRVAYQLGKVGTQGQSQVKNFADVAAAEKSETEAYRGENEKRLCGKCFSKRAYPPHHQSHS